MQPNSDLVWAIVPAAGVGRRMGADRPKQYLDLSEKMVIDHTLGKLGDNRHIHSILVGVHDDDSYWRNTCASTNPDIHRYGGGKERADTVLRGLRSLVSGHQASVTDWVLVHDAVRPCVRKEDLAALIEYCFQNGQGAVIGSAVVDTIKRVDSTSQIIGTEDRSSLWRALTPQMFPLGLLQMALENAVKNNTVCTDEAQAMELAGHPVKMLAGDPRNIKITQASDLRLATFYLQHEN